MAAVALDYSINTFLKVSTPTSWLNWALQNEPILLWDHSNCEKKAASSALSLLFRYPKNDSLVYRMSRLAREELRHFEQVQNILVERQHAYEVVKAPNYASRLRQCIRSNEPQRLIDQLIVGAFIEARSCERFAQLAPKLDAELSKFYSALCASEERHFVEYLNLAQELCDESELAERIELIAQIEAEAVQEPSDHFSFHSGPPSEEALRP